MMNDIQICSSALIQLGADEISSFEDQTREAKLCSTIYETTVRSCLSERDWSFAKNQTTLNKLTDKPLYGYASAFKLPSNYLRLCGKENPGMPHSINEQYLYCNASEVKVTYIFRAKEERFPAYFLDYVINVLSKKLAMQLSSDEGVASFYKMEALESRKKAGIIDSQSNGDTSAMPVHNFSLFAVRY